MEFLDEEDAKKAKIFLEESLKLDPTKDSSQFSSNKINWIDSNARDYNEIKSYNSEVMNNEDNKRLFLLLSPIDEIKGKPQLIHENIQRIPMIRYISKKTRADKDGNYDIIYKKYFINDSYDKRYNGEIESILAFDFYIYRVIDQNKEYYIFTEKKLPNEYCSFKGIKINMDDISDINDNLKVKKISTIFICKEFESNVKIIKKEDLVEFTKEKGITEEIFNDLVFSHPNGNVYDYTDDFNLLRKSQLLSGKYEGYPLHLFKMGIVGTGKTTEAEVLDYKFNEDQGILEANNSTLKALVPSFKEKPANLGYICKCNRISIIDELMKMVESAMGHDYTKVNNYFGQMNMLLEHKERMVGSGNNNSTKIKATSKICITTNNVSGKNKISAHLSLIDPTTLSRFLVWIQDSDEVEKIWGAEALKRHNFSKNPPQTKLRLTRKNPWSQSPPHLANPYTDIYKDVCWDSLCVGGISIDDFLTIYDSCQLFLVNYDKEQCIKIFKGISALINCGMKNVWRSRGLHHTILLLDGIVKHRCLFIDYDNTFTPIQKDYDDLERLLTHMVKTWETSFDYGGEF